MVLKERKIIYKCTQCLDKAGGGPNLQHVLASGLESIKESLLEAVTKQVQQCVSFMMDSLAVDFQSKFDGLSNSIDILRDSNIDVVRVMTGFPKSGVQGVGVDLQAQSTQQQCQRQSQHLLQQPQHRLRQQQSHTQRQQSPPRRQQKPPQQQQGQQQVQMTQGADVEDQINTRGQNGNLRGASVPSSSGRQPRRNPVQIGSAGDGTLRAVERRQWVHVGRLCPGTSLEMLESYVKDTIGVEDVVCERLSDNADMCTFKVGVRESKLGSLLVGSVWPNGVAVREFFQRRGTRRVTGHLASNGSGVGNFLQQPSLN